MKRKCKKNGFRRTMRRAVSAVMTAVMLVSGAVQVGVAAEGEVIVIGPAEDIEEVSTETGVIHVKKEKLTYQIGKVRTYFAGTGEMTEISVLFTEEEERVWVDGSEFLEKLSGYGYTYDTEGWTAEIKSYNKMAAFEAGLEVAAYRVGDAECFFNMKDQAKIYKGRFWIPAEAFSYLTCTKAYPMAVDMDTSSWDPEKDFLIIEDSTYTVMDVLLDLFAQESGMYWMFTYEDDFSMSEKEVENMLKSSKIALNLYGTLTADVERILSWATKPLVEAWNGYKQLANTLFGTELEESETLYDHVTMENFIQAMLNSSSEQMETIQAEIETNANLVGMASGMMETAGWVLEDFDNKQLKEFFLMIEADDIWPAVQEIFEDYSEAVGQMEEAWEKAGKAVDGVGAAANLFLFGYTAASIVDQVNNHDAAVLEAMEYYLESSKRDTEIKGTLRKTLEEELAELQNKYVYAGTEIIKTSLLNAAPDLILSGKTLSAVGIVTTANNVIWNALEKGQNWPLATADEPAAMQMSMYSIMYELDAWRELTEQYESTRIYSRMNNYKELRECALLALNYLKSSLVSCEAGMKAKETPEFEKTMAYGNTRSKMEMMTGMIQTLKEALNKDADPLTYGVLMYQPLIDNGTMDYDLFLDYSARMNGIVYSYHPGVLDEPEITIYPLIRTEKEILNNGGTVVKYGDRLYYWEIENVYEEGYDMDFVAQDGIRLVCVKEDGTKTYIMKKDDLISNIYILNERMYMVPSSGDIYSCNLDGGDVKIYDTERIAAVEEEQGILIDAKTDGLYVLDTEQGESTLLVSTGDYFAFVLAVHNDVIYYGCRDMEKRKFTIESIQLDGTGHKLCAEFEYPDSSIYVYDCYHSQISGDKLFTSWKAGTPRGTWLDAAFLTCINLDGTNFQILYPNMTSAAFLVTENSAGEDVLYYDAGISEKAEYHWDDVDWIEGPIGTQNLSTEKVEQADMPLACLDVPFGVEGSCVAYTEGNSEYTTLITAASLQNYGIDKLGEQPDGSQVLLRNVEVIGDEVYFHIIRGIQNGTYYGNFAGFDKKCCEFCCYRAETDTIERIYEY